MGKIRLLLADDHALFREGLRQLLEHEEDLECVAMAQDGEEAVEMALELLPDIALIDIAMPKIDGIEVAKRIKLACPTIAVLILSAYEHDNYVFACMRVGVDGYLLKNMPPSELVNAIRMVHTGEAVFNLEAHRRVLGRLFGANDKGKIGSGQLRSRQLQLLKLAANGMSSKDIADELSISIHTVRTHFTNIFRKLGVESRTEAVSRALKEGLITMDDLAQKSKTD